MTNLAHTLGIVECQPLKHGNHEDLCAFTDALEHNINCLKDSGQYDIGYFICFIIANKLNKRLNELWLHFSRDVKLRQSRCGHPSSVSKGTDQDTPYSLNTPSKVEPKKWYKPPVHNLQPESNGIS